MIQFDPDKRISLSELYSHPAFKCLDEGSKNVQSNGLNPSQVKTLYNVKFTLPEPFLQAQIPSRPK